MQHEIEETGYVPSYRTGCVNTLSHGVQGSGHGGTTVVGGL